MLKYKGIKKQVVSMKQHCWWLVPHPTASLFQLSTLQVQPTVRRVLSNPLKISLADVTHNPSKCIIMDPWGRMASGVEVNRDMINYTS